MTTELVDLRIRELPRLGHFSRSTLWWGVCGLIAIEMSVFGGLTASYFYLRLGHESWPPPGTPLPDWQYGAVATALLLVSSYTIQKATTLAVQDRSPVFFLGASIGLAVLSDVVRFIMMWRLPFRWDANAYASIYWAIAGLHFVHVIVALLGTGLIAAIAAVGRRTRLLQIAIEVDGLYWQFVVWIWVPMYLLLYILPRFWS